jgi:hypothetical protein
MPFGITGLGNFAQQAPEEFPRFIQFQQDGVDLGDNAVEVVNLIGGLVATRGTGESVDTLTIDTAPDAGIAIEDTGVPLGNALTLNFAGALAVELVSDVATITPEGIAIESAGVPLGNALTVNFTDGLAAELVGSVAEVVAGLLTWRTVTGDDIITDADIGNGLWVDAASGVTITVPEIPAGRQVLIVQAGAGVVALHPQSGITLLVRSVFQALTAGQGAILTLIAGPAGSYSTVVCGDMAAA